MSENNTKSVSHFLSFALAAVEADAVRQLGDLKTPAARTKQDIDK
jgi:hypothetical protein